MDFFPIKNILDGFHQMVFVDVLLISQKSFKNFKEILTKKINFIYFFISLKYVVPI